MGQHNGNRRIHLSPENQRSHANQARASAKKKRLKAEKRAREQAEADTLGITVPELVRKKFLEAQEAGRARIAHVNRYGLELPSTRRSRWDF
jgi:hypothetical protein